MDMAKWTDRVLGNAVPAEACIAARDARSPVRRRFAHLSRRLFTATLSLDHGEFGILMFHACHAADRVSAEYLGEVSIRRGIDVGDDAVLGLVPERMRRQLAEIGDCCPAWRPLAGGGVLHIFQRSGG